MNMNKAEFQGWMKASGYSNINDWNMQEIDGHLHYFIKNYTTGKYALLKEFFPYEVYYILVEGWIDYNGWDK